MPIYTCEKCNQQFKQKSDHMRHINKKYPCITQKELENNISTFKEKVKVKVKEDDIKEEDLELETIQQILISNGKSKSKIKIIDTKNEDLTYEIELKRIQDELHADLYLHVFNNSEANIKFKKFYEDSVSKVFAKFITLCKTKVKKTYSDEYVRDFSLFDDKNKIKTNDVIKKKLMEIYNENETYFNKRLLKYALNLSIGLTDMKYVDVRD